MRCEAEERAPRAALKPREKVLVASAPRCPCASIVWSAEEPRPRARFTPAATCVVTSGRQPPPPEPFPGAFSVPRCCCAALPLPNARLTPTVTLVADSGQPRLASIRSSVAAEPCG